MKKVITILLVLLVCFSISACSKDARLSKACTKAEQILDDVVQDSEIDMYITCYVDTEPETLTICGCLDGAKQALIDQLKKNTSNPSWLNKGTSELLEKELIEDDATAKDYFFGLMTSETAKQVQACFGKTDVKIIYQYKDIKGKFSQEEYKG